IMVKFEKELLENRPDVVLVVGDVTSTMACTITAKKLCIDVVHVEAGIRSGDMTMPEEINRIVTDSISDYFFTTSETATDYLINSGVQEEKIFFVGNTMIDSLNQNLDKLRSPTCWDELKLKYKNYFLLTLHRPSNVDDENVLKDILEKLIDSTKDYKVIFPVHPRTFKTLEKIKLKDDRIKYIEPLSYHEFLFLVQNAKAIITDSGGITEEATVLNIPCLTLRTSTERPETVSLGTNELIGNDLMKLGSSLSLIMNNEWKEGKIPPLWDGKASERIVQELINIYSKELVTA
ncbi:MAG: UDP-N-acetylglucosamine 2-epimerase (non-hydrolyzing), partial [Flavobacterium sp.]